MPSTRLRRSEPSARIRSSPSGCRDTGMNGTPPGYPSWICDWRCAVTRPVTGSRRAPRIASMTVGQSVIGYLSRDLSVDGHSHGHNVSQRPLE